MGYNNIDIQGTLKMEKKLKTKYLSMRINMSLLEINAVGLYRSYSQGNVYTYTHGRFYINFSLDIIENHNKCSEAAECNIRRYFDCGKGVVTVIQ